MSTKLMKKLLLAVLLGICAPVQAGPKTDVVHLKNGDRITGEIKSLMRGKLELSTDHIGTIEIEWEHIDRIISATGQSIELGDGRRLFGTLEKPESDERVRIVTATGDVGVGTGDIIAMYPVEAGFWERLDLSAQLGFSWDKSSDVGKYSIGVNAALRDPRFLTRASLSTDITTQKGQSDTTRTFATLNHMRFLENKRFRAVFGNLENNDELGLDLRALFGAGYGWIPVRSQRTLFGLMLGLAANREIPQHGDGQTNLEGVGSLTFEYFFYGTPERLFRIDLNGYPGLSNSGRWRAVLDTSLRIELVADLFWELSGYASYDNEPPSTDASTSDYGVTSSLGYKF